MCGLSGVCEGEGARARGGGPEKIKDRGSGRKLRVGLRACRFERGGRVLVG